MCVSADNTVDRLRVHLGESISHDHIDAHLWPVAQHANCTQEALIQRIQTQNLLCTAASPSK